MAGEDLSPSERAALQLGKLLNSNPEVRLAAQRLAKKVDPNLRVPEIELQDQIQVERDARLASEQKMNDQLLRERLERRHEQEERRVVAAGFTMSEIDGIITEYGCKDYDTAMKIATMQAQSAAASTPNVINGGTAHLPIDPRPEKDWRGLDTGALRKKSADMASDIINGFRGRKTA